MNQEGFVDYYQFRYVSETKRLEIETLVYLPLLEIFKLSILLSSEGICNKYFWGSAQEVV